MSFHSNINSLSREAMDLDQALETRTPEPMQSVALMRAQQVHNSRLEQVAATLSRAQQLHTTASRLRVVMGGESAARRFASSGGIPPPMFVQQLRPPRQQQERRTGTVNPSIHPQFRSKAVVCIQCSHCTSRICSRGMKAILLGNTKVELYSTDTSPAGVQLVYSDYTTRNCLCRIRDAACLGCGNVVGYHVTQPCEGCLEACNNGHFWMFHAEGVKSSERMDDSGSKPLKWASLPSAEVDERQLLRPLSSAMLCR